MSDDDSLDELLKLTREQAESAGAATDSSLAMFASTLSHLTACREYARVPWEKVNGMAAEGWQLDFVYRNLHYMWRQRPVTDTDLQELLRANT